VLGDGRRIAVCRELTKLHEEIWRGTIADALAHFASPRGEFTLVIEGAPPPGPLHSVEGEAAADASDAAIAKEVARLRRSGASAKDAVAALQATFGVSRRVAYSRWHE
jgi:16S rRNA (cytidine1402-2'-O)-methyltransferase